MNQPLSSPASALLADQVVIITGAAGDLGLGIARQCLDAGACVALCDLDTAGLNERIAALAGGTLATTASPPDEHASRHTSPHHDKEASITVSLVHRILSISCDVSDAEQTRSAIEQTMAHWGRIDALVNNAAVVTPGAKIGDLEPAQWQQALDVNLTGAWLMSKWALAHMRAARRGVILNVASQLGSVGAPGRGAYGSSKAGMIALARAIAVDHADEGIRALSLSPGAVLTGRVLRRYGDAQAATQALAGHYLPGRLGTVEEISRTALFLLSEAASFITGTDIRADGGYTAR